MKIDQISIKNIKPKEAKGEIKMTNQIKFFMAEELHNYMEDQAVAILGEKIENDKLFTFDDMAFFYKIENEKEIVSKYPELESVLNSEQVNELETFIDWNFECWDENTVGNGLIEISEAELLALALEHSKDEDFETEFMNNPKEALKQLKTKILNLYVTVKLGEILGGLKKENIQVDWETVQEVAEMELEN